MIEQTISIERIEDVIDIFGSFDENIKLIEHELDVSVVMVCSIMVRPHFLL